MKLLLQVIVTGVVCFMFQQIFPWWSMAIGALLTGFVFSNSGFKSFLAGFVAIGLLWLGMAWYTDMTTHAILTDKINALLPVNVFVLTTLVGGLVGGLASLAGSQIKP